MINGKSAKAIQWREATQLLIIFIGLPAAFVLWAFRDHHVNGTLANQRKDVNLKEFQEIQLRAAGALDEKLPAEAREQLQIAALHQLRGFLRGDFGPDFCRPAFELLLAGHTAAMERIGLREAIDRWRAGNPSPANIRGEIDSAISEARSRWTAVDRERAGIVRDERQAVFHRDWPLNGRRFDGIRLPAGALLARLQLGGGVFIGADLFEAHLEGANLRGVNPASIRTCAVARYDDRTIFVDPAYRKEGEPTADEVREQWRAKGARHVDELKGDE